MNDDDEALRPSTPFAPKNLRTPDTVANQAFGFWLYLMSDLVLFAAIFATYAVLGHNYAGGPTGKDLFRPALCSSAKPCSCCSAVQPAVWPCWPCTMGRQGWVLVWLAVTFLLGLGFIVHGDQ